MKNIVFLSSFFLIFCLNVFADHLTAGSIVPSNMDFGGKYETITPDGIPDYKLKINVSTFTGKSITKIVINNIDGQFTVWDTIPNNGMWALIVTDTNYNVLSQKDSSLLPPLNGNGTYYIFLPDNGSIKDGKTHYKLTLYFSDGTKLSTNVSKNSGQVISHPAPKIVASFRGLSGRDYGGRYEHITPDGESDYLLVLNTNLPGKRIVNISIRNIDGQFTVWDTIPNNNMWALIVTDTNYNVLSKRDSSLLHPLNGYGTYYIFLPDNGSIKEGRTHYFIELFFSDGTSLKKNVVN